MTAVRRSLCLNMLRSDAPLQMCLCKVVTLVYLTDAGRIVFANNPVNLKKNLLGEADEREKCFINRNFMTIFPFWHHTSAAKTSVICSTVGSRSLYLKMIFNCFLSLLPHLGETGADFSKTWSIRQNELPLKEGEFHFFLYFKHVERWFERTLSDVWLYFCPNILY